MNLYNSCPIVGLKLGGCTQACWESYIAMANNCGCMLLEIVPKMFLCIVYIFNKRQVSQLAKHALLPSCMQ